MWERLKLLCVSVSGRARRSELPSCGVLEGAPEGAERAAGAKLRNSEAVELRSCGVKARSAATTGRGPPPSVQGRRPRWRRQRLPSPRRGLRPQCPQRGARGLPRRRRRRRCGGPPPRPRQRRWQPLCRTTRNCKGTMRPKAWRVRARAHNRMPEKVSAAMRCFPGLRRVSKLRWLFCVT